MNRFVWDSYCDNVSGLTSPPCGLALVCVCVFVSERALVSYCSSVLRLVYINQHLTLFTPLSVWMHFSLLEYFKLYAPSSFPSSLHPPATPPNFPGAFKARGPTSGHVVGSGADAEVTHCGPFGSSLASSFGVGAANLSSETIRFQLPSHTVVGSRSGFNVTQMAPLCSENVMAQSVFVGGGPQMDMNPPCGGVGMLHSGSLADTLLVGTGMGQSSYFGGNQAGAAHLGVFAPQTVVGVPFQPHMPSGGSSGETMNKNSNPFFF